MLVGDYCYAKFYPVKNGWKDHITCQGTIIEISDTRLKFKDNDGIIYEVEKDRFEIKKPEKG